MSDYQCPSSPYNDRKKKLVQWMGYLRKKKKIVTSNYKKYLLQSLNGRAQCLMVLPISFTIEKGKQNIIHLLNKFQKWRHHKHRPHLHNHRDHRVIAISRTNKKKKVPLENMNSLDSCAFFSHERTFISPFEHEWMRNFNEFWKFFCEWKQLVYCQCTWAQAIEKNYTATESGLSTGK